MLEVGQVFESRRVFTQSDFDEFAELSGDDNPIHVDPEFAAGTHFGATVAHGMLLYSALCGALSEYIPGAVQIDHEMMFPTGTPAGEEVVLRLEVESLESAEARLSLAVIRPNGERGLQGFTRIRLPEEA